MFNKKEPFSVAGVVLLGIASFIALYFVKEQNYLLFHSLVEIFSIVVAVALFALAWNSRHFARNTFLLWIGVAYLFVAIIDLIHTFTFRGMNVLHTVGANPATQLWIAARYLQAASLLIAIIFSGKKSHHRILLFGYALVTGLCLLAILEWNVFPDCYNDSLKVLTPFKVASEYIIISILLMAQLALVRTRKNFERITYYLVSGSIIVTMASELSFTLYDDPYGLFNMTGHYLKVVAFYLIYKALIVTSLKRPYEVLFRDLQQSEINLRESEKRYRSLVELTPEATLVLHAGRYAYTNPAAVKLFGARYSDELLGKKMIDLVAPEFAESMKKRLDELESATKLIAPLKETAILRLDGSVVPAEMAGMRIDYQDRPAVLAIIRDMTKRKEAELATEDEHRRVKLLLRISKDLQRERTQKGLLQQFTDVAIELLESRAAVVGHDLDGRTFLRSAASFSVEKDENPSPMELLSIVKGTIFQSLLSTAGTLRLTDEQLHNLPAMGENSIAVPWRGLMGASLVNSHGKVSGLILVTDKSGGRDYKELDASLLSQLAAIASLALQNIENRYHLEETVRQRTQDLLTSQERYRNLVEYNPDTIFVTIRNTIVYTNPSGVVHLRGATTDDILGRSILDFATDKDRDAMKRRLEKVMKDQVPTVPRETRLVRLDGQELDVEAIALPIPFQQVDAVLVILRNISERKKAQRANIAYQKRLAALAAELSAAEEKERHRIAEGLHDLVGQKLALARITLGMFMKAPDIEKGADLLDSIRKLIDETIEHTRSLTFDLSPPILHTSGLEKALDWLCETFRKQYGTPCNFQGNSYYNELDDSSRSLAFRVTRELMINALKHSKANSIELRSHREGDILVLEVHDDGVGFDAESVLSGLNEELGFGLFGIRERLKTCGGQLTINSTRDKGTVAKIEIPLIKAAGGTSN